MFRSLPRTILLGVAIAVVLFDDPDVVEAQPTDTPPSTAPSPPKSVTVNAQVTLEGPSIGDVTNNQQQWLDVQGAVRRDIAKATEVDDSGVTVTKAQKTGTNSVRVDVAIKLTDVTEAAIAAVHTPGLVNGNVSLPLTKSTLQAQGRQLTSARVQIADADANGFSAAPGPVALSGLLLAMLSWAIVATNFVL
jgi:hypothetical protein